MTFDLKKKEPLPSQVASFGGGGASFGYEQRELLVRAGAAALQRQNLGC